MQFKADRNLISEALALTSRVFSGRTMGVSGVKIVLQGNKITIDGTDGDLRISKTLTVDGKADGSMILRSRLMSDIVRAIAQDKISVKVEGSLANITAGTASKFSIRVVSEGDESAPFPVMPETSGKIKLDGNLLTAAIDRAGCAASTDESRPILTGVCIEDHDGMLRLAATDSYRLAVCDIPDVSVLQEGEKLLVPVRALKELARIIEDDTTVVLSTSEQAVTFDTGDTVISSRLIQGDFPNYSSFIPENNDKVLTANKAEMVAALRRVGLLALDQSPIKLKLSKKVVEVTAVTVDVGEAKARVEADYDGEPLTVAFKQAYLIDGIEAAEGDNFMLKALEDTKPCLISSPDSTDFTYLLMPVRTT